MYDRISELYTVYALPIVQCHAMFFFFFKCAHSMGKMRKQFNRLCHVRTIKASSYLIVISAEMFIDNSVLKPVSAEVDVLIKVQRKRSWGINHDGH